MHDSSTNCSNDTAGENHTVLTVTSVKEHRAHRESLKNSGLWKRALSLRKPSTGLNNVRACIMLSVALPANVKVDTYQTQNELEEC